MENMENEFMAEQLQVLAETVKTAKKKVCRAVGEIYKMGLPENVADWYTEFCRSAEMLAASAARAAEEKYAAAETTDADK